MNYEQLETDYKYDCIAEAMYSREVEYFHYDFDRTNFLELLTTLPEGEFRTDIQDRLVQTEKQMEIVDKIYEALKLQIGNPEAFAAAVIRTKAKRDATNPV